jgi:hypothetical protein
LQKEITLLIERQLGRETRDASRLLLNVTLVSYFAMSVQGEFSLPSSPIDAQRETAFLRFSRGTGNVSVSNAAFVGLVVLGAAFLAFLLLGPVLIIPLHIPINYNEGWNALFDNRAVTPGAGPLYPPKGDFVFNNYPPLGFYVVGAFGRFVFGDMILAGRVISLVSLLLAGALTGLCVRLLSGSARSGLAAGLLMLLFMSTFYRTYVAMDDPQLLAHATMLCGLAILLHRHGLMRLRAGELPIVNVLGAVLLMIAGGFIKHNLVALPCATTCWLLAYNRRAALLWSLAAIGLLACGAGITFLLHGPIAFADIFHHPRVFRPSLMTHSFSRLAPMLPMALLEIALLRQQFRGASADLRSAIIFITLFGSIALITGIAQRTGEGVYYNAHFETLIAVCIGFGVALKPVFARGVTFRGFAFGAAGLTCLAAAPLFGGLPWHVPLAWQDIEQRSARAAAWQPVIARIAVADGRAGCLLMSLCWWAGKPSMVDVFNLTESLAVGGPSQAFQEAVTAGEMRIFEDDPASFTHRDGIRQLGYDPVMGPIAAAGYTIAAYGPEGSRLLVPAR